MEKPRRLLIRFALRGRSDSVVIRGFLLLLLLAGDDEWLAVLVKEKEKEKVT